ncbi:MAG: tRNA (adenosine(37)-N6)-threonylcarbamoyltransferase complex ATPase subunit type 1 TsaE [Candidatus Marinimicrobia bacterium]|nr:tRNA (adenosine(37)-N6)-threonylcarbamoyltransferase complex ATPase subunit type 1 TsaE [Candidatus Neomarinimicrobiota bacterium]MBL7030356.1 tRNA (adenosine(37)-N6)-threonylcarbamoyltransferase complex ATPase subunit type 1 TsaE [Candidatus Neomarinimicrobiota bacterium]
MREHVFHSVQETQSFAKDLAQTIPEGSIIALIGNLGSGKTTFAQGFALGLDIQDSVISPTFKLVSEYEGTRCPLYHIDCYRLDAPEDFLNIGGENYLNPEHGITLIEWAERIEPYWTDRWIFIYFNRLAENANARSIKISGLPN